jgi:hypothetical protein
MGTACALPVLLTIRIELADGCPTLFEARAASPMMLGDFDQPFLACFTAILANLRLGCSTGADCFTATNEPPGPIP